MNKKFELIDGKGNIIAREMDYETVVLFSKTLLENADEITIRRMVIDENKKIVKDAKEKAAKMVQDLAKEEIKKVVEEKKNEITNETTDDIMSLFE